MESASSAEFAVIGVPDSTELGIAVRGKLFTGPLRVGDVFTRCEGPREILTEPSLDVRPIRLGVLEIRFYQQLVHELDEGHGAELLLIGDGSELVSDGVVLHTHSLVDVALSVATTPPGSMDEVERFEEEFAQFDHGLPGYDEFELALASYRPGGGPQLLDEAALQSAAKELLHELGHHSLCLHNVPLEERP